MNQLPGIIGKKLGCTQVFQDDGTVVRVTVVEAGPVVVLQKRTPERDGYSALQLGFGDQKPGRKTKAELGHFQKAKTTPKRWVKELRLPAEEVAKYEVGQALDITSIFTPGERVDATGESRGRGFTGVMRRWNFAGMGRSHGAHEYERHGGSIGTNMTPGRTLPGKRMPGQYGSERVTIQNLKVARIDAGKHLIMIEGAVPGSRNQLVTIRKSNKGRKAS
ncbi:MAG: 50S ribosomal protein L3 [Deltaproteobacteria bacterium]|nr:50S ribosomal protein L3 [Deltaproteobacteria bacterium]